MKFYKHNDLILLEIIKLNEGDNNIKELKPNTNDGAFENHVPVVKINNNNVIVKVGEIEHPMEKEHYIMMIAIETNLGYYVKHLNYNDRPYAEFTLVSNERFIKAYEYCNIHSLWSN